MSWGTVEVEPEVERWLTRLGDEHFGHAQFYVDLLEREGVALGEPYTRQLRGKLRELRFYVRRERYRITYYIATGRRIILLTVFKKSQQRETEEIDRADVAMQRCIARGHTAGESDEPNEVV
jgi:hypothetical protein